MRQETYRFAYEEASAELRDILEQFEQLRLRRGQMEKVVEALQPFAGLGVEPAATAATETADTHASSEPVQQESEPVVYTFQQLARPVQERVHRGMERQSEPVQAFAAAAQAAPEPVEYTPEPSADPFQRRIDDALWGWRQRPTSILSTT